MHVPKSFCCFVNKLTRILWGGILRVFRWEWMCMPGIVSPSGCTRGMCVNTLAWVSHLALDWQIKACLWSVFYVGRPASRVGCVMLRRQHIARDWLVDTQNRGHSVIRGPVFAERCGGEDPASGGSSRVRSTHITAAAQRSKQWDHTHRVIAPTVASNFPNEKWINKTRTVMKFPVDGSAITRL